MDNVYVRASNYCMKEDYQGFFMSTQVVNWLKTLLNEQFFSYFSHL